MIGMTLRVEMLDGELRMMVLPPARDAISDGGLMYFSVGQFLEDMKFKALAWLAWDSVRSSGVIVELFPKWVEKVGDITFVPKEKPKQDAQST